MIISWKYYIWSCAIFPVEILRTLCKCERKSLHKQEKVIPNDATIYNLSFFLLSFNYNFTVNENEDYNVREGEHFRKKHRIDSSPLTKISSALAPSNRTLIPFDNFALSLSHSFALTLTLTDLS